MHLISRDILPPGIAGSDQRATLRRAVRLEARVRGRGATRFTIRVVDLSPTGLRAETAYGLHIDSVLWIALPGLQGLEATVAWRRDEAFGAQFRRPLHPAVFEHIAELGR